MKTHKERVQSLTKAIKSEDVIIRINRDDNHIKVFLNTNIDIDQHAKLIDAAPDLLEALNVAYETMLQLHDMLGTTPLEPQQHIAFGVIQQAINKATL